MIQRTIHFKSPVSEVWKALTDIDSMRIWYFDLQDFKLEVGNQFHFYESNETKAYFHACEITELESEKIFAHTWRHPQQSSGTSIVRWELKGDETETIIHFSHSGVKSFADAGPNFSIQNFEFGWKAIIETNLRNFLYGIKRLEFKTVIKASKETIWNTLWHPDSYTKWTSTFCEGSYYTGKLVQGERIHFMDQNKDGMYSDVLFLKENQLAVFSHIGYLSKGIEKELDAETKLWTGTIEMYTLTETTDGIELKIESDTAKEYIDFMQGAFSKGIAKIKELSEG